MKNELEEIIKHFNIKSLKYFDQLKCESLALAYQGADFAKRLDCNSKKVLIINLVYNLQTERNL